MSAEDEFWAAGRFVPSTPPRWFAATRTTASSLTSKIKVVHIVVRRCVDVSTHILAHRRQRQRTRSRTHPPPARTKVHHSGTMFLRTQRHTRRSRCPRSSPHHGTHAQRLFPMQGLTRRSHHPRRHRSKRAAPFYYLGFPPSFRLAAPPPTCSELCRARSALRHGCTRARTHARARRTTNDERRGVRSAGVADWITA